MGDNGLIPALAMNPAVILTVGAILGALIPNGFAAIRRPLMLVFVAMSAYQLSRLGLGEFG
ncbi:MAG TPA: hypothetical protein PKM48_06130, partial [Parvularculaceae bacterium]|nr:hypothetical protein [Parvularculaceae bacterium]